MRELAPARKTVLPALSFAILAGLFASAHASAQAYPVRNVDGWTVAASKGKQGCFLTRTYEGAGETTLLLGLDTDGSNHLSVLNGNWSIEPKARLKLRFRLSGAGYSNHPVVGMTSGGKKGFVTSFETVFLSRFAASKALHIHRGDVPVEQLTLDGSGAAVSELRRCVGIIGAGAAVGTREKRRSGLIPKDPFAPDAKAEPRD